MDVREHRTIQTDELRVSAHAHIGLKLFGPAWPDKRKTETDKACFATDRLGLDRVSRPSRNRPGIAPPASSPVSSAPVTSGRVRSRPHGGLRQSGCHARYLRRFCSVPPSAKGMAEAEKTRSPLIRGAGEKTPPYPAIAPGTNASDGRDPEPDRPDLPQWQPARSSVSRKSSRFRQ